MRTLKNKFAGRCRACWHAVPAGAGAYEPQHAREYRIRCDKCVAAGIQWAPDLPGDIHADLGDALSDDPTPLWINVEGHGWVVAIPAEQMRQVIDYWKAHN